MAGVGTTTNPTQTGNLPINGLINNGTQSQAPAQTGAGVQLGQNTFLKLLTTELQNQDPLSPMDDTQSVTQLAQFQALDSQVQLASSFQAFQQSIALTNATTLIGHTVSVNSPEANGNSSTITGKVAGISVVNGTPQFALVDSKGNVIVDSNGNPLTFQMSQITGVVQ